MGRPSCCEFKNLRLDRSKIELFVKSVQLGCTKSKAPQNLKCPKIYTNFPGILLEGPSLTAMVNHIGGRVGVLGGSDLPVSRLVSHGRAGMLTSPITSCLCAIDIITSLRTGVCGVVMVMARCIMGNVVVVVVERSALHMREREQEQPCKRHAFLDKNTPFSL